MASARSVTSPSIKNQAEHKLFEAGTTPPCTGEKKKEWIAFSQRKKCALGPSKDFFFMKYDFFWSTDFLNLRLQDYFIRIIKFTWALIKIDQNTLAFFVTYVQKLGICWTPELETKLIFYTLFLLNVWLTEGRREKKKNLQQIKHGYQWSAINWSTELQSCREKMVYGVVTYGLPWIEYLFRNHLINKGRVQWNISWKF